MLPSFSQPLVFMMLVLAMFVIIAGRYFLIAGLFHLWFLVVKKERFANRRLSAKPFSNKQFKTEVKWSLITAAIFAFAGAIAAVLWQNGYTRLYTNVYQYGLWYLPVSLLLSLFIHETYYYWLHRWMHRPAIFKVMHKVHHDSNTTSAWTAFSFHPIEGVLQALILPLTIIFLPMQVYVLLVQLTIMTFSSVINHLEIETYPARFNRHFIGRWIIGATHHSLHHKQFKYNFGLYFTFWDKWKRTESPKYNALFDEKTHRAVKTA